MTATPPALKVRGLSKSFVEGKPVLRGVDLTVEAGEVHALVGANGSGKSTLIKILAGYHKADGTPAVSIGGQPMASPIHPDTARSAGARFVHQEHGLVAGLTVVDNMRLGGRYLRGAAWKIRWKREAAQAREQFSRFGIDVDPLSDVEGLPLVTLAKLSIVRALQHRAGERVRLVVLDEPTASLGQKDASHLIGWVRGMARDEGVGVLFVGHRLPEVFAVGDSISVLRNGELVASGATAEFTPGDLVEAIVGRRIDAYYPERRRTPREVVLAVEGLSGGTVREASFSVRRGEMVGLTGLAGAGFEDVPYLLADREQRARGRCELLGEKLALQSSSMADRIARGMALVPADRARLALASDLSVRENVVLPRLRSFYRGGLLREVRERADVTRVTHTFGVVPDDPEMTAGQFSGGNQQKIVVGKWLATSPTVLLLHEPTQGVDVGARSEIFKALAAFAEAGGAVLIASVEYEDLAHICDRVLAFGRGRVMRELAAEGLSPEAVAAAAYHADVESQAAPVP